MADYHGPSGQAHSGAPNWHFTLLTRISNFVLLIAVFVVNGLASSGNINNIQTGRISDLNFTYVTPAGYAFSIWGLIYFTLAVWSIYQLWPKTYEYPILNDGIGYAFIFNCIFNIVWIFVWQYNILPAAVVFILLILATLVVIYFRLSRFFTPAESWLEWFLIHLPFSLYLGWLIAASIVCIYAASTTTDPGYIPAAIAGLVVALIVEGGVGLLRRDPVVPAVGAWAFFAISSNAKHGPVPNATIDACAIAFGATLVVEAVILVAWNALDIRNERRPGYQTKK